MCVACRKSRPRSDLLRLTVDSQDGVVKLNPGSAKINGRSAYLCPSSNCLNLALKGTRLKYALEGRKVKGSNKQRSISWPLESQLIQVISAGCTEP